MFMLNESRYPFSRIITKNNTNYEKTWTPTLYKVIRTDDSKFSYVYYNCTAVVSQPFAKAVGLGLGIPLGIISSHNFMLMI